MLPYMTSQHSILNNDKLIDKLAALPFFHSSQGRNPIESGPSTRHASYMQESQHSATHFTSSKACLSAKTFGSHPTSLPGPSSAEAAWKGHMEYLHAETRSLNSSFVLRNKFYRSSTGSMRAPAYVSPIRLKSLRHVPTTLPACTLLSRHSRHLSFISLSGSVEEAFADRVYWRYLEYVSKHILSHK